jgi:hypothetical protein
MPFDAQSARALSRRVHSVHDCLFILKQAVVQAAQAGEFEVTVDLAEQLPVVAGQSSNTAAFVIDLLARSGREAWSEAATQAQRAGYTVRPAWGRAPTGAALEGLTLAWQWLDDDDAPAPTGTPAPPLLLMPAAQARAISQAEQAHVRWVEAQHETIQRSARRGLSQVALDDVLPAQAPEWIKRRQHLERAGFTTELIAAAKGATLLVRW